MRLFTIRNGTAMTKHHFTTQLIMGILLTIGMFVPTWAMAEAPDKIEFHFEIVRNAKSFYSVGDTVVFRLIAKQTGKTCTDGVNRSRLFGKGIKITKQSQWLQTSEGIWQKNIETVITGNSKNDWQITAFRKTDKDEVAETVTLKRQTK